MPPSKGSPGERNTSCRMGEGGATDSRANTRDEGDTTSSFEGLALGALENVLLICIPLLPLMVDG
jgi:hypothetical protein